VNLRTTRMVLMLREFENHTYGAYVV